MAWENSKNTKYLTWLDAHSDATTEEFQREFGLTNEQLKFDKSRMKTAGYITVDPVSGRLRTTGKVPNYMKNQTRKETMNEDYLFLLAKTFELIEETHDEIEKRKSIELSLKIMEKI